jgi:hypothetical protein
MEGFMIADSYFMTFGTLSIRICERLALPSLFDNYWTFDKGEV